MTPSRDQANQFAIMLASGAPAREAIRYFLPAEEDGEVLTGKQIDSLASRWLADREVERVYHTLTGGEWTSLSPEQKIRAAIDKHYVEMAYFLYSRNYVDLIGPEKAKADTCRAALEAKLAGTAGKLSAVEQFWSDVTSGKIKLGVGLSNGAQPISASVGRSPEGAAPREH